MAPTIIDITYSFPDIGRVTVPLYDESASLYRFLEDKGEVARLEKLDYLGHLREVHKTAHYSRWEYVVLQLHFLNELCKSQTTWGLKQSVRFRNKNISSVEELLKCWALLLNYGHLHGIFDAERFWMRLFWQDSSLRERFLEGMPSQQIRIAADQAMKSENFYSLCKFLAAFALARQATGPELDLWASILEANIVSATPGTKMSLAQGVFRAVRNLAFITLDLSYAPLGIRINAPLLLKEIAEAPEGVLYGDESPLAKEMDNLQQILFQRVYATPDAVAYRVDYWDAQTKRVEYLRNKWGPAFFTESLERLWERLNQARKQDFTSKVKVLRGRPFLRLELMPDDIFEAEPVKCFTAENRLNAGLMAKGWRFVVTPTAFAQRSGCFLDVFSPPDARSKEMATAIRRVLGYIGERFEEWRSVGDLFGYLCNRPLRLLLEQILYKLVRPGWHIRLQDASAPGDSLVEWLSPRDARGKWSRAVAKQSRESPLDKSRLAELASLRRLIREEKRGHILLCLARVQVFDQSWRTVAEIDGLFLRIFRNHIEATFLESKRRISRQSEQAMKALSEALDKAFNMSDVQVRRRKALAYTVVRLDSRLGS